MARSEKTESPLESECEPKVNVLVDSGVFSGWWVLLALAIMQVMTSGVVAFAVAEGTRARSTQRAGA